MSALQEHTTVMLTPTAPTPKDRFTARVIRDTLEMESRVLVSLKTTVSKYEKKKNVCNGHSYTVKTRE